jgi:hypothetical protein
MRSFALFLIISLSLYTKAFTLKSWTVKTNTFRIINIKSARDNHKLHAVIEAPNFLSKLYNYIEYVDDTYANGFILAYANTTGFNYTEPIGAAFLLTNLIYIGSGVSFLISNPSDSSFYYNTFVIEMAGLLSFNYHYNQLLLGPGRRQVKYTLLLDYIGALSAICMILVEILRQVTMESYLPVMSIELSIAGALCLLGSWVCLTGYEYIMFHGLWHIFSGAACYDLYNHI